MSEELLADINAVLPQLVLPQGSLDLARDMLAAIGIPAAILAALRPGPNGEPSKMVAVPREPIGRYRSALTARQEARSRGPDSPQMIDATESVIEARRFVLEAALAASEADHDKQG